MREFPTGATRSAEEGKPDYEGFLSPLVLESFGKYMNKHRVQADGSLRASDNWQKGIPRKVYVKSLLRHVMTLWLLHRQPDYGSDEQVEEALNAILFNTQGYLLEFLRGSPIETPSPTKLPEDC